LPRVAEPVQHLLQVALVAELTVVDGGGRPVNHNRVVRARLR
jgi:hypothetical protein